MSNPLSNFINAASRAAETVSTWVGAKPKVEFVPNLLARSKELLKSYGDFRFIKASEVQSAAKHLAKEEARLALISELTPVYHELLHYVANLNQHLGEKWDEGQVKHWKRANVLLAEYEWILGRQLGVAGVATNRLELATEQLGKIPDNSQVQQARHDFAEYRADQRDAEAALSKRATQADFSLLRSIEGGCNGVADAAEQISNGLLGINVVVGGVSKLAAKPIQAGARGLSYLARTLPAVLATSTRVAAAGYATSFTLRQVGPATRGEIDEVAKHATDFAWNTGMAFISERLPVVAAGVIATRDLLEGAYTLISEGKAGWKEIDRKAKETADKIILDMQLYALAVVLRWVVRAPHQATPVAALPSSGQAPTAGNGALVRTTPAASSSTPSTSIAVSAAGANSSLAVPDAKAVEKADKSGPPDKPRKVEMTFVELNRSVGSQERWIRSEIQQAELYLEPWERPPGVTVGKNKVEEYYLQKIKKVEGSENLYEAELHNTGGGYPPTILFTLDRPIEELERLTQETSIPGLRVQSRLYLTAPVDQEFGEFYNRLSADSPEGYKTLATEYIWSKIHNDPIKRHEFKGWSPTVMKDYIHRLMVGQQAYSPGLGSRIRQSWFRLTGRGQAASEHPLLSAVRETLDNFDSKKGGDRLRALDPANFDVRSLNHFLCNLAARSALQQNQGSRFQEFLETIPAASKQRTSIAAALSLEALSKALAEVVGVEQVIVAQSGKDSVQLRRDLETLLAGLPIYLKMYPPASGVREEGRLVHIEDLESSTIVDYFRWAKKNHILYNESLSKLSHQYQQAYAKQYQNIERLLAEDLRMELIPLLSAKDLAELDQWLVMQEKVLRADLDLLRSLGIARCTALRMEEVNEGAIRKRLNHIARKIMKSISKFKKNRPDYIKARSILFGEGLGEEGTRLASEYAWLRASNSIYHAQLERGPRVPANRVLVATLITAIYDPSSYEDARGFFQSEYFTMGPRGDMRTFFLQEYAVSRFNRLNAAGLGDPFRDDRSKVFQRLLQEEALDGIWDQMNR